MAYINWSEKLSVNVTEIDEQHKTLIEKINRLHQAMLDNKGREVQKPIIDAMADYAASHFEKEEKYMQRYGFPGLHDHRTEHDKFTAKAIELKERFDSAGFVLSLEILTFLKNWLQEHILVTDKKYSKHFNDNGLY